MHLFWVIKINLFVGGKNNLKRERGGGGMIEMHNIYIPAILLIEIVFKIYNFYLI